MKKFVRQGEAGGGEGSDHEELRRPSEGAEEAAVRRRWPRSRITTVNQLRRARGFNLWTHQMNLWKHHRSHQMTRKEELEMYWMEQTAEIRKKFKKRW